MATKTIQVGQVLGITVAQAAEFLEKSRSQTQKQLMKIHLAHPEAKILHKPFPGARQWEVSIRGLRRVQAGEFDDEADAMAQRVTLLEADVRSIQRRIGRIEESIIPQRTCRNGDSGG